MKNKLLLLGMLLLVMAGASMPRITSALQDHSLEVQTDARALDAVDLTLGTEGGVRQVLTLLSSSHTDIELEGGANLTVPEAEEAAGKAVALLTQEKLLSGFDPEGAIVTTTAFVVLPDKDAFGSAMVWECVYTAPDGQTCTLVIDDATGKMVFVGFFSPKRSSVYVDTPDNFKSQRDRRYVLAERWMTFLLNEYGFDGAQFDETLYSGNISLFDLVFTWVRQGEKTVSRLPLNVTESGFSLNRWFRFDSQAVSTS